MKNYEEMAADVFRRIDEYQIKKRQKKQRTMRIAVPAVCCCVAVAIGAGMWQGGLLRKPSPSIAPPTSSTVSEEKTDAGSAAPFIVLYAEKAKAGTEETLLQADEEYPYRIYFDMVSTKGLSQAQKDALFKDCVAKAKQYTYKYTNKSGGHSVHATEDECIVTVAFTDLFRVKLDSSKDFKQMRVYNTATHGQVEVHGTSRHESGRLEVMPHGQDVVVTKEMAERMGGYTYLEKNILSFAWEPTADSTKLLDGKDRLDYTAFNDTIHVEIDYMDGTKSTASVKLVFDETGEATVICGGYSLFAQ